MAHRPDLTVAAVVERAGEFLLVEERMRGALVVNQPAGRVEAGESPVQAVVREMLEETAWRFEPHNLTGLYLWRNPDTGRTTLRVAFCGACDAHDATRALDRPVVRTLWLTRAQVAARTAQLRNPLVLRCIDDYLGGERYPLAAFKHVEALHEAATARS